MTVLRRTVLVLLIAVLAVMSLGLATGSAQAAPKVNVGGGTAIVLGGKYQCTMTAVGRDRSGGLVGLTAAHCAQGGNYNVSVRGKRAAGIIGRVTLLSKGGDFAVVALDAAKVRPVRSVGQARISSVGRVPSFGTNVCKMGATTGFTCGPMLQEGSVRTTSYVCAAAGDSGGPVLHGSRLVGMLNGGQRIGGVALQCPIAGFPIFSPMVATKISDILAVLHQYGRAGAGFRPI
ncbi:peptidase S1 family protein [Gordonia hirsuta DSM 44140 = NBRC 16056]|uniref:Peptidase S1 family protein n=1 Tax=Gordonia hirsuta DSM 44140 = NBRC 16056 TaxID=1121927 RepID=L7L701_9ACTN|nr:S1 family peptidase [Gordonia hirsuta]GAC56925.1 peptidase S1 family protein [Gordonia hirsuta DSM 44140 = NBRC 16056]